MVAVAIPCSIFGSKIAAFGSKIAAKHRERQIVKRIIQGFGEVVYDWEYCLHGRPHKNPPGSEWCRAILGDDFFATVAMVSCDPRATDDDLRMISELEEVEVLILNRDDNLGALSRPYTGVTDVGLWHLRRLRNLKHVQLHNKCAAITDTGIEQLQMALPDCEVERALSGTHLWFRHEPEEYRSIHYPPRSGKRVKSTKVSERL